MAKKIVVFKSEEPKDIESAAQFLRELADKLSQRQVVLRQGENEVVLTLPDNVVLEIKVDEKEQRRYTKRSLEVEIEWREGENAGSVTLG